MSAASGGCVMSAIVPYNFQYSREMKASTSFHGPKHVDLVNLFPGTFRFKQTPGFSPYKADNRQFVRRLSIRALDDTKAEEVKETKEELQIRPSTDAAQSNGTATKEALPCGDLEYQTPGGWDEFVTKCKMLIAFPWQRVKKGSVLKLKLSINLARMLVEEGQAHLFTNWPAPGVRDDDKCRFFDQVAKLDSSYPGGLAAYIRNARKLLVDSKAGKNPFTGYVPSVPEGERLVYGDEIFMQYEEAGVKEAQHSAFVLVAGGLGERLGYSKIKVALPAETTTKTSFLQLYIKTILAFQDANSRGQSTTVKPIPLVIMTSDDTHQRTQELLETNKNFGMLPDQIVLLKQEKVACLSDNDASIALDPSESFLIQTKPHGHGDVHSVLFSSGLLSRWQQDDVKWVLFFQDTNGLLFKGIPASLGVSALKDLDVNSLAVNRKAKEAIGGIARLTHENGSEMVINVEYNQLDPLLRATGHAEGDVNDETGFSPFPGNINQLVLKLSSYIEELSKTNGAIVEFVNPKYKDASKTSFKSSTRLECMMQDYPRTLPSTAKVGFTVLDTWLAYAPVKNHPEDAAKVPRGNPLHSATSGEMAIYRANSLIFQKAGVNIEGPKIETYNGQEVEVWPRIVWSPKWALTFSDVKRKVKGLCQVSQRSTLVLDGDNVTLDNLVLDGALIIRATIGSQVNISSMRVFNDGWEIIPVDFGDKSFREEIRMRGFEFERVGQQTLFFDQPEECCIRNVSM